MSVKTSHKQSGAGLIEVLVTVLILATSLLAMGALQNRSLQFNHSAYLRSQANVLAYDILDRMRINRESVDGYDGYDFGDDAPVGNTLAARDLQEWLNRLERTLPGGEGDIECDANRQCTISLRWIDEDEAPEDAGEDAQMVTFTYSSRI